MIRIESKSGGSVVTIWYSRLEFTAKDPLLSSILVVSIDVLPFSFLFLYRHRFLFVQAFVFEYLDACRINLTFR